MRAEQTSIPDADSSLSTVTDTSGKHGASYSAIADQSAFQPAKIGVISSPIIDQTVVQLDDQNSYDLEACKLSYKDSSKVSYLVSKDGNNLTLTDDDNGKREFHKYDASNADDKSILDVVVRDTKDPSSNNKPKKTPTAPAPAPAASNLAVADTTGSADTASGTATAATAPAAPPAASNSAAAPAPAAGGDAPAPPAAAAPSAPSAAAPAATAPDASTSAPAAAAPAASAPAAAAPAASAPATIAPAAPAQPAAAAPAPAAPAQPAAATASATQSSNAPESHWYDGFVKYFTSDAFQQSQALM